MTTMTKLKTQVGRADILRLLAVSQTASADAAAKLLSYQLEPEQQAAARSKDKKKSRSGTASQGLSQQEEEAALHLNTPVEAKEISRTLPSEAFWYLTERKQLKKTLHRFADIHNSTLSEAERYHLPGVLYKIKLLEPDELSVPEFHSCPAAYLSASLPPCSEPTRTQHDSSRKHPSLQADMEGLVAAASELISSQRIRQKKKKNSGKKKQAEKKRTDIRFHLRLRRLLGLMSVALEISPSFLQEIFRLLPSALPDTFSEAALESHPDVEHDSKQHLALRPEKKKLYHLVFADEESSLQADMLRMLRQHHARKAPLVFALELLPLLPLLHSAALQRQICLWLEKFMLRFVRTWFEYQDKPHLAHCLVQHAENLLRFVEVLPKELKKQLPTRSFLYGIVHRGFLRTGAALPSEYDPEAVIGAVRQRISPVSYQVLQQGEQFFLYPSSQVAAFRLPGSPLVELELTVDCLLVREKGYTAILPVRPGESVHSCPQQEDSFLIQTPTEQLVFKNFFRPAWARTIGRNTTGLFVDTVWLGKTYRLSWKNSISEGRGQWIGNRGTLQTDQYGLFVDLAVKNQVMQRFRRIMPGCFMMGSPDDEAERESWGRESLHEVVLSKGFWVADTVVTQRLWRTVVGENPGCFKGAERPAEQVSYHDAIFFLRRLNTYIPGIRARLLTEAEWEYCCRAGSSAPFCFGSRISPEQVNYNGRYPYQKGRPGRNRQQTVPVKSLPCNAWGLYEMHGNVWEWCQDHWQEDLSCEGPQTDPQGPKKGEFRVVRGGSWFLGARGVRSAVRGKFAPHCRNNCIGFRIALTADEEDVVS